MSLLSLQEVTKFYGRQDVLRRAGFQINHGERVGLVGRNGAGKSTLLRIILGKENPDDGFVHKAKSLRLGYLPQDLMTFTGKSLLELVMDTAEEIRSIEDELSEIARELEQLSEKNSPDEELLLELTDRQGRLLTLFENLGGYSLETEARKILDGLGFSEVDLNRPIENFSGGWIMRAVLARLLLAGPDLLLLDEPTNHLDIDSLLWLENYLLNCPSALLLVSHDRVFLNNVVKRIVEVERGMTISYQGNYDRYLEEKERRLVTETAAYESQQERIKQAEKFIERNRVRAATARRAQSKLRMLEKMDKLDAPVTSDSMNFKFNLPEPSRAPDNVAELAGISKSYGAQKVYSDLNLTIRRGDRIAFLGANGLGKSTLMKILAGATDYQQGSRRIGSGVVMSYFAQFQLEELNPDRTVLEELDSVAGDLTPGRQRSILGGFLFKGDDVFKKVAVLSGGEKTRLILSKIMVNAPNLLLLDEPSNHLDIPGRDMLEQALKQYAGTICLISHDRRLIDSLANKVLVIEGGTVDVFPGNFKDYQQLWMEKSKQPVNPEKCREPEKKPEKNQKGLSRADREARKKEEAKSRQQLFKLSAPLIKEIESLEKNQAELTARMDAISAELAKPETYQDNQRSKDLNLEYASLKTELDKITDAWEIAAVKLEEIEQGNYTEVDCLN